MVCESSHETCLTCYAKLSLFRLANFSFSIFFSPSGCPRHLGLVSVHASVFELNCLSYMLRLNGCATLFCFRNMFLVIVICAFPIVMCLGIYEFFCPFSFSHFLCLISFY